MLRKRNRPSHQPEKLPDLIEGPPLGDNQGPAGEVGLARGHPLPMETKVHLCLHQRDAPYSYARDQHSAIRDPHSANAIRNKDEVTPASNRQGLGLEGTGHSRTKEDGGRGIYCGRPWITGSTLSDLSYLKM